MSIFAFFHSPHDLHQLKKACSQQRSNAVRSMHYKELETALFHRLNAKKCAVCGALFTPGSNRAKYCPECAARMKRVNAAKRKRKQREKCHALGAENPL